jgi:hypothetical protein
LQIPKQLLDELVVKLSLGCFVNFAVLLVFTGQFRVQDIDVLVKQLKFLGQVSEQRLHVFSVLLLPQLKILTHTPLSAVVIKPWQSKALKEEANKVKKRLQIVNWQHVRGHNEPAQTGEH